MTEPTMAADPLTEKRMTWDEFVAEHQASVRETYPGLTVRFQFLRIPQGLVIEVYDSRVSETEPVYLCTAGPGTWPHIVTMMAGALISEPGMAADQYRIVKETGQFPPGWIMEDGTRP